MRNPVREKFRTTQFISLLVICGGVCALAAPVLVARVRAIPSIGVESGFMAMYVGARSQENGSQANASFNSGAELAVMVHDASGSPIAATAMVHVYRGGTTPSGQASTSDGRAIFVLSPLGDFTVVVEAAGYQTA